MADGDGRISSGSGSVGIALGSMGLLALKDEACEPYEKKKRKHENERSNSPYLIRLRFMNENSLSR